MKTCPVCKLDYAESFKYCEFDGSPLAKSSLSKGRRPINTFSHISLQNISRNLNLRLALQVISILFLSFTGLFLYGKNVGAPSKSIAQSPSPKLQQQATEPVFFETPQ